MPNALRAFTIPALIIGICLCCVALMGCDSTDPAVKKFLAEEKGFAGVYQQSLAIKQTFASNTTNGITQQVVIMDHEMTKPDASATLLFVVEKGAVNMVYRYIWTPDGGNGLVIKLPIDTSIEISGEWQRIWPTNQ